MLEQNLYIKVKPVDTPFTGHFVKIRVMFFAYVDGEEYNLSDSKGREAFVRCVARIVSPDGDEGYFDVLETPPFKTLEGLIPEIVITGIPTHIWEIIGDSIEEWEGNLRKCLCSLVEELIEIRETIK